MQVSRSEQKRRVKQIEKLVQEIVTLPAQTIRQVPCSRAVRDLFLDAQTLKGGAKKRQLKYITKLLRDQGQEELYIFVSERKGEKLHKNKQMQEIVYLRDQLINEALQRKRVCEAEGLEWSELWKSRVMDVIEQELPAVEKNALLRLAYLFAQTRNPRHSREIFRYLMAQKEQEQYR
ncbi:MAG: hypothetical protein CSA33_02580 [Desulfobulbus propionicus]|nr:MAG: hypothetical protein CSA33_02580 [Desulfobulbus propionicus]